MKHRFLGLHLEFLTSVEVRAPEGAFPGSYQVLQDHTFEKQGSGESG